VTLSRRAATALDELRADAPWAEDGTTTLVYADGRNRWWTFAGLRANAALHGSLAGLRANDRVDNFWIELDPSVTIADLDARLAVVDPDAPAHSTVAEQLAHDLKFADCLPEAMAVDIATARLADTASVRACLSERRRGWNA
jgi:ATP-dependent Lhr-like helicase